MIGRVLERLAEYPEEIGCPLFTHAADGFPPYPEFDEPLSHPGLSAALLDAAEAIGYRLV